MLSNEDHGSDTGNGLFWVLLLSSALIHIPLSLPEFYLQFALFDLVLPIMAISLYWQKRPQIQLGVGSVIFAIILSALLVHSLGIFLFKDSYLLNSLLKETLKTAVLIIQFQMLLFLFRSKRIELPSVRTVGCILVIAAIGVGLFAYITHLGHSLSIYAIERHYFARTVYCIALTAMFFLLAADEEWVESQRRRWRLVAAGALVAAISIASLSKSSTGLVLAMTAWIAFGPYIRHVTLRQIIIISVSAAFMAALGAFIANFVGDSFEALQRMDSIERSVSVRLALWSVGLNAFAENFPWGVGFGQYAQATAVDISLALEGHRFAHNSFVSLAAELGVLGAVFSIGLIVLRLTAARGWALHSRPLFLLLVMVPLTIQDGHSIRMLLVVTALGLARHLYKTKR